MMMNLQVISAKTPRVFVKMQHAYESVIIGSFCKSKTIKKFYSEEKELKYLIKKTMRGFFRNNNLDHGTPLSINRNE